MADFGRHTGDGCASLTMDDLTSRCVGTVDMPAHDDAAGLTLAPGAVDIWVALVDEVAGSIPDRQFTQELSEEERLQSSRFLLAKDRYRYLVTRALVRYVLSRYVPLAPQGWRFGTTAYGRPIILNADPGVQDLSFNISHSGQVVVLALTRTGPVGIDVEAIGRPPAMAIADSYFSARELRQLRAVPAHEQGHRFLEFWTLKESYIKARGMGLSLPLQKIGFELDDDHRLQTFIDSDLEDAPGNWSFWQWRPSVDSIGALCVQRCPDISHQVVVHRTVPFAWEERAPFDVLRHSFF